jgi:hypothetical protein
MNITNNVYVKTSTLFLFALLLCGCISSTRRPFYNVAENYNATNINKVGILVVRMGNIFPSQTLPLTPDTDFSITTPKYGWHGKMSEKTQNVYVEDEQRLKKSFPHYPATSDGRINFLTDHYTFEFYKNFSPEIYIMLADIFKAKGYEVVNIAGVSETWDKPVSESAVFEIIDRSKESVDALVIFQYLDIGTSSLRIGSSASKREGFLNLEYSLYMFDTLSKEVIFDCRNDFPAAAIHALMNDPVIAENPMYKDKVRKFNKGFGRWNTLYFVNELPEEVNSERIMHYIKNGIEITTKSYGAMKWTGLTEIIPEK